VVVLDVVLLTGLICGAGWGEVVACDQATAPPKVEFGVKGTPCLQPIVLSPDAELKDFRMAEGRWLSKHYPGRSVPRWESVLVLPPETPTSGAKSKAFFDSETAYVQAPDGSEIAVCFYIGLKTGTGRARE